MLALTKKAAVNVKKQKNKKTALIEANIFTERKHNN